jgi:hypothetical protein
MVQRPKGWKVTLLGLGLGALLSSGCVELLELLEDEPTATPAAASSPARPAAQASANATVAQVEAIPAKPAAKSWGKITVRYDEPKKKKYKKIASTLKASGEYDRLAEQLTRTYKLPSDLLIRFTQLGEENAYYDPNTNEITVGYELIDSYSQIFEIDKKDPKAYEQELIDAGYFTVFHELGHALVEMLDIPFTGSEEDAVDEFATLALLKMGDQRSESALISGIEQFNADAAAYEDLSELSFSDEHSFDKQRFYDVLALVYGSDPEYHSDLIGGDYLPEEMAEEAEAEYERKKAVWERLLAPHLRQPDTTSKKASSKKK